MQRRFPLIGLYREALFSRRQQRDTTILQLTGEVLTRRGFPVEIMVGEALNGKRGLPLIFTMCQGRPILQALKKYEEDGTLIINRPSAIYNCYRMNTVSLFAHTSLPFPQSKIIHVEQFLRGESGWSISESPLPDSRLEYGLWVKRGDVHAIKTIDVSFVSNGRELKKLLEDFHHRGITEAIFQEHIEGISVKFYALRGGPLLDWFPTRGEMEISIDSELLFSVADQAAGVLGLDVYGGDCIVTRSGEIYLVDLNAWPSFSTCQPRAAEAIATYIIDKGIQQGVI